MDKYLSFVSTLHPSLSGWYETGHSRKSALKHKRWPSSAQDLEAFIAKQTNRDEMTGAVIEDLGYQVHLWNGGGANEDAGLGVGDGITSRWIPCSTLDLSFDPDFFHFLGEAATMRSLVLQTATIWNCDWVSLQGRFALNPRSIAKEPWSPAAGWLVYCRDLIDPSVVQGATRIETVSDGFLVVAQNEVPDDADEAYRARTAEIDRSIRLAWIAASRPGSAKRAGRRPDQKRAKKQNGA